MQSHTPTQRHAPRKTICTALAAALLALTLGVHAQPVPPAQDAEEQAPRTAKSMGPLAPLLVYGQDDQRRWQGGTDGNAYRLSNPEDPNAITYFYLNSPPEDHGRRSVQVKTVILQGEGSTGLIYGFAENPKQYFLYTLDRQGQLSILHRLPEGGFKEVHSARIKPVGEDAQPAGPRLVTLRLAEQGGTVTAFLNDQKFHTFNAPGQGGLGIAAMGRVDGLFLDFNLKTTD